MNFKLFALVGIFLIVLFAEPANASCLDQGRLDDRPNYVVIGAFRIYKNAIRFTAHAHKDLKMNAKFELNPYRKLYYVYVLSTDDQTLAINEARRLREESEFTDTWVYFGTLGDKAVALVKIILQVRTLILSLRKKLVKSRKSMITKEKQKRKAELQHLRRQARPPVQRRRK